MKRQTDKTLLVRSTATPLHDHSHDYGPALQSAVSWLGDRYLLAEPVRRRAEPSKAFFVEPRRWYPATRH
jgi:hypothetical protein